MRSGPLIIGIGAIVVAVACNKQPAVQGGASRVTITLNCEGNGATIGVHPWRAMLASRSDSILWTLAGPTGYTVSITPKDPARWPFSSPPPIVVGAQGGVGKNIPAGVAAGTYKYVVTGVCVRSGQAPDTVILDPDMIIPPLLERN